MSRFNPRNRDRNPYGGQDYGGGGGYNQNMPYQGDMGRQQMMNPWQAGMMPRDGGMQAGRSNEAALAFNILNQVLASDPAPMMNTGQHQRGVFQDRQSRDFGVKSRIEDRRRGNSPDFSNKNRRNRRRRKRQSRSRSPQRRDGHDNVEPEKKSIKERLGKVNKADKSSDAKRSRSPSQEHPPESKRKKTDKSSSEKKDSKTDTMSKERDSKSRSVSKSREGDAWDVSGSDDKDKEDDQKCSDKDKDTDELSNKENEEELVKHLKCHICEVDAFESIKSFQNHKNSKEHELLFDIYNQRNDAVLKLMRADSKLYTCREKERAGYTNRDAFSTKCVKCDCLVGVSFKNHKKTIEHELVDNHILRQCCDMTFAERTDFEEHILSLPHFRNQEDAKETDEKEKIVMAHTDEEEEAHSFLKDCKENSRMLLDSAEDFPEYDAEKPIGMEYVHKKRRYNCNICKKSFPAFNDLALSHCRSLGHYLKLLSHLQMQLKGHEEHERERRMANLEKAKKAREEKVEELDKTEKNKENEDIEAEEELGENMPPLDEGLLVDEELLGDVREVLLEDNKDAEDEEQETEQHSKADGKKDNARDDTQGSEEEEKEEPWDEEMQSDVAEDEDQDEPNDEEMPEVESKEIQEEKTKSSNQEVQEEEDVTGEEANDKEEEEDKEQEQEEDEAAAAAAAANDLKEEDTSEKKEEEEEQETKDEDKEEKSPPAKPKARSRRRARVVF